MWQGPLCARSSVMDNADCGEGISYLGSPVTFFEVMVSKSGTLLSNAPPQDRPGRDMSNAGRTVCATGIAMSVQVNARISGRGFLG